MPTAGAACERPIMVVDVTHKVTRDKSFPISAGRVGVKAPLPVPADGLGHDHQECTYGAGGDQAIEGPCRKRTGEPAGVRIRRAESRPRACLWWCVGTRGYHPPPSRAGSR